MNSIELSFCIPVMNRFEDIKSTLKKNLEDNRSYIHQIEFVVICFDSDFILQDWIEENFRYEISIGYLKFFKSLELQSWHFGRAKNAFKRFLKGRIYASLDADNFTGHNGGKHIIDVFKKYNYNCIFHQFQGDWGDGTCGRVSLNRKDYIEVGYDNTFLPRQWDELDLMLSVLVREPKRIFVCYEGKNIINKSHPFKRFLKDNNLNPEVIEIQNNPSHGNDCNISIGLHSCRYVEEDIKLKYSSIYNHLCSFFKNSKISEKKNKYVKELQDVQRLMTEKIDPFLLESWVLKRQDKKKLNICSEDLILLSCVKNEPDILEWYHYYKKIGVTKFLILDDYSDKKLTIDLNFDDVHVWYPISGKFRYAKVFWIEILLRCYCKDNWCITVDSDEYLSLPDFHSFDELKNKTNLKRITDYGEDKGIRYFAGFLLDVFPSSYDKRKPLCDLIKSDFDSYQFRPASLVDLYKKSNTACWSYGDNYKWAYKIDIRYRLNRSFDSLRKFPIFKFDFDIHLNQGFHDLIIKNEKRSSTELNRTDLIPIIHYKLKELLFQKLSKTFKDTCEYHQETALNLNRIITNIEQCINNAMISPFTYKYMGYAMFPLPNLKSLKIEEFNSRKKLTSEQFVDRKIQKLLFIKSNCEPYLKGIKAYGRTINELVEFLKVNTPFKLVTLLSNSSAVLIQE